MAFIGMAHNYSVRRDATKNFLCRLARSGPSGLGLALHERGRFDDICAIADQYDCLCDLPYPLLYKKLAERYPDSLFVLTTRSSEDKWLESLRALNLRNGRTEAFRTAYGCYEVAGHEDQFRDLYRSHNESVRQFFAGSDRFVERHCRKGRYGAAVRYARSVAGTPELMALIDRSLDGELRLFLALTTPKTALQRLRLRAK